jgi:hypothetical protein
MVEKPRRYALEENLRSDAHESSILAEVLGLASIFLPGNRLALLEPYSINSPSPATHFPLCHGCLRPSTPLASPREAAALPDDPRLASCASLNLLYGGQAATISGREASTVEKHRRYAVGTHLRWRSIYAREASPVVKRLRWMSINDMR